MSCFNVTFENSQCLFSLQAVICCFKKLLRPCKNGITNSIKLIFTRGCINSGNGFKANLEGDFKQKDSRLNVPELHCPFVFFFLWNTSTRIFIPVRAYAWWWCRCTWSRGRRAQWRWPLVAHTARKGPMEQ